MNIAYFDCFCGAAGDMIVAACLDAGVPADYLCGELSKLHLPEGVEFEIGKVNRAGISATYFKPVEKRYLQKDSTNLGDDGCKLDSLDLHHTTHKDGDFCNETKEAFPKSVTSQFTDTSSIHNFEHRHSRTLTDIEEIIQRSHLKNSVKRQAIKIFQTLAQAEAKVHGTTINEVHFHEVGGFDAIADIVGSCIAFEYLNIERFYSSSLTLGGGTVWCRHGLMPVPAPATAEMIKQIDITPTNIQKELLTPTGAAILTTVVHSFGKMPAFRTSQIGYGAGTHNFPGLPNVLRLFVGTLTDGLQLSVCEG